MYHELKTDSEVFEFSWRKVKSWEIRKNDRNFSIEDTIRLRETEFSGTQMAKGSPLLYTGREMLGRITYIFNGSEYGLQEGWVILSLNLV
jgi:hypothetical protein